jgi:hypothetical protein
MQDISGDLQERAKLLRQRMRAEQARFQNVIEQLKKDRDRHVEGLKAELGAVDRLAKLITEQQNLRTALTATLAVLDAAGLDKRNPG